MDAYTMDIKGKPHLDIFEYSETQKFPVGARYRRNERIGRVFHYCKAGGAPLVAADLIQSAAAGGTTTYQHDLTPSATAKGKSAVSVTVITDTLTKNQFAGGVFAVTDGDAIAAMGDIYEIKSHPAGGPGAIVFTLKEPLAREITAASRITIIKNIYDDVIQAPVTTPTGLAVGVAPAPIPANWFGWLQTWGLANMLVSTALTAGMMITRDNAAAGSVGNAVIGTEGTPKVLDVLVLDSPVGASGWVTDTGDTGLVFLRLDP